MKICLKTVAASDFLHDRRDALGAAPGVAEAGGPKEEAARGRICATSPHVHASAEAPCGFLCAADLIFHLK